MTTAGSEEGKPSAGRLSARDRQDTMPPADDVVVRVLEGLQRIGGVATVSPRHTTHLAHHPLPRRVPGNNLLRRPSWAEQKPPPVSRDAAAIAMSTRHYFQGRRGLKVVVGTADSSGTVPAGPVTFVRADAGKRLPRERVRPAARRIVTVVLRLIPAVERPRYGEEFRAELAELKGLSQLAYAARLLFSTPALRRSLREDPLAERGGRRWPLAG